MEAAEHAWHAYVASVTWLRDAVVPVVDVNVLDFINALLAVVAMRAMVRHRIHWVRSLVSTFITSTAGGSLLLLCLGRTPRWLLCSDTFHAIILAWYVGFVAPWPLSLLIQVFESPQLAVLRSILRAICMACFMSAFGIENVVRALREHPEWSGSGRNRAHVGAFLTAGIAGSCGGGLVAEYLNVLQLPQELYLHPSVLGPSQDFTIGLFLSMLYVFVLRGDILPSASGGSGSSASLLYPLSRDRDTAIAVLVALAVCIHLSPIVSWRSAAAAFLERIPGWRTVFIPAALRETTYFTPGYAGTVAAYGYELVQRSENEPAQGPVQQIIRPAEDRVLPAHLQRKLDERAAVQAKQAARVAAEKRERALSPLQHSAAKHTSDISEMRAEH